MGYTISEARDMLNARITEAWVGIGLNAGNLVFQDIKRDTLPNQTQVWARVRLKHGQSQQVSLADHLGKTKFERMPVLMVQIFTPRNSGLVENDRVSQGMLDVFEGKHIGGIWFRDASTNEIGIDGSFFNTNIFATVIYNQVK